MLAAHDDEPRVRRRHISHDGVRRYPIDPLDPDPDNVVALLDGIDGAYERAQRGLRQAATGQTVPLDEL